MAALHCNCHRAPQAVYAAVPHNRNGNRSSVHARFKRLSAVGNLSVSAHAFNHQAQEHGVSRQLLRKGRNGVAVAKSQRVADVEGPQLGNMEAEDSVHKVVIVGGGIAGLSAAVALHRVGVKSLVLERSSSIRATGASLSLWANAWRALDYLGVADGLRKAHIQASGVFLYDRYGKLLRNFQFSECPGGPHEVRGVERKLLIDALAAQLPPGTIQLNCGVRAIREEPGERLTKVELENGSVISTKILVGCDGANSVVAKWMGLPPTRYVGQIGIRGVAEYSNGHDFGDSIVQYLGSGSRCGIFPFSDSKVYWFYLFKSSSPGPKVTDRNLIKAEVLREFQDGWPEKMSELLNNTPTESVFRSALADRWNIPGLTPPLIRERVALAGDAMHPMTPSLGQGGGTAIEDAIVLGRTLGVVLAQDGDAESIQKALGEYATLRQQRTFPITVKSFLIGSLFALDFAPVVYIRNNVALPKLVGPSTFLSHTLFDVGKLPISNVRAQ
ncbi:unnamed protein product [Calypogeia fissa]